MQKIAAVIVELPAISTYCYYETQIGTIKTENKRQFLLQSPAI